jgi:hypothetical protein
MDIVLNGKQHPLEGPMNVAELIDALGFAGKRIAVERQRGDRSALTACIHCAGAGRSGGNRRRGWRRVI